MVAKPALFSAHAFLRRLPAKSGKLEWWAIVVRRVATALKPNRLSASKDMKINALHKIKLV